MERQHQSDASTRSETPRRAPPARSTAPTRWSGDGPALSDGYLAPLSAPLYPKLEVGGTNDPAERAADAFADAVVRGGPVPALAEGGGGLRRKCSTCEQEDATLHRKERGGGGGRSVAPPVVHRALASPGHGLDAGARRGIEARAGLDLSGVRVHTDALAAESAAAVGARAYTVGRDLVFGAGEYRPGSQDGLRLIAHEVGHLGSGVVRREEQSTDPGLMDCGRIADLRSRVHCLDEGYKYELKQEIWQNVCYYLRGHSQEQIAKRLKKLSWADPRRFKGLKAYLHERGEHYILSSAPKLLQYVAPAVQPDPAEEAQPSPPDPVIPAVPSDRYTVGIGLEVVNKKAFNGRVHHADVDPGHAFVYTRVNGDLKAAYSFGPIDGIGAANVAAFLGNKLQGRPDWRLDEAVTAYEASIDQTRYLSGLSAMKAAIGTKAIYSPSNQCTTQAVAVARAFGVNVPSGLTRMDFLLNGIMPVFSGVYPSPFKLAEELSKAADWPRATYSASDNKVTNSILSSGGGV